MNAGLQLFATASARDSSPWPPDFQHLMRSPRTSSEPLHLNRVACVTVPVSSAAASVMTLNAEPGSYVSVTMRFFESSSSVFASERGGFEESNVGYVPIARISPVFGFIRIPCTLLALLM